MKKMGKNKLTYYHDGTIKIIKITANISNKTIKKWVPPKKMKREINSGTFGKT